MSQQNLFPAMAFLYEQFDTLTQFGTITNKRFDSIEDNLSPKFPIREYQTKSFARFDYFWNTDFDGKQHRPVHLLYNMATGSGKTLIMAGLILYLYQKGHRNFLFFVNSNNIIQKTKDNFLNHQSSKYLFADKIVIDGQDVLVKEIDNFDEADDRNINIKFTTIQQLHIDLNNTKENSVTYEDFKDKKIVLIADEAHHLSSGTRSGDLFGSWENTVENIHKSNLENVLLEFTATLDYTVAELRQKYENKVIFKYDLSQFRLDKFSKEISLIRSEFNQKERIIQALILNLYRQELATSNNVNLKPVVLFKAKRTIPESEKNKEDFHKLIDDLSAAEIENVRSSSTVPIIKKAFRFFESKGLSVGEIVARTKSNFKAENCLSANNDKEEEKNQLLLNSLEDENNPIRAIFAVRKVDEGWDVLNLFDIVRLYEGRDSQGNNPGRTTISEAQLIGRGARYFPFKLDEVQDKFTRKFDDDISNDLKVLEELYYHAKEDSRYISELKIALVQSGIFEDDLETKQLKLKEEFKKTKFYLDGSVILNSKVAKSFDRIKSFADLGVSRTNFRHKLASGFGKESRALGFELEPQYEAEAQHSKDIKLSDIPKNVVRFALTSNPFFHFDNLSKYFPHAGSTSNFIENDDYLGGLAITFLGSRDRLKEISNFDQLQALSGLLQNIESDVKQNSTEFEGSDFFHRPVRATFKDKEIRVPRNSERANGQENVVSDKAWYVFNANYGTAEEKKFVELFSRRFEAVSEKFKDIYLIRNERELKIFDKLGRAFEPDFLLFCKQKAGRHQTYQVFIEPKGSFLIGNDKWKKEFLLELGKAKRVIKIETDEYVITGVPFYNYENENEFAQSLEKSLEHD